MNHKDLKITNTTMVVICTVYYTTKMLWDYIVPYIFELFFLATLTIYAFGFVKSALKKHIKQDRKLLIAYIFLVSFIIIRLLFSDKIEFVGKALYEYCFFFLTLLSLIHMLDKADLRKVFKVLSVVGAILVLLTWIEYLRKVYFIPRESAVSVNDYLNGAYGFRAAVFSRSYLNHGIVIGFYSLVYFAQYYITKKRVWMIPAILALLTINTTGSRGPLVAIGIAWFVFYFCYNNATEKFTMKKIGVITTTFLAIVFLYILLTTNIETSIPMVNQFLHRFRGIIDWSGEAGNRGRLVIWNHFFDIFSKNRIWGVGVSQTGSYNSNYGATESGLLKRLVEIGIVGFIIYYNIIILTFASAKKRKNNHQIQNQAQSKNNLVLFFFSLALFIAVFVDDITLQATEELMVVYLMWFGLAGYYVYRGKIN